jgi:Protein of unknown function (DUF2442)
MVVKIVEARYLGDYKVWLRFSDGVEGNVDLANDLWGEVFEPLKDQEAFGKVRLDKELHTLVWPNGADFAPEFLYQKLCPDYTLKSTPRSGTA